MWLAFLSFSMHMLGLAVTALPTPTGSPAPELSLAPSAWIPQSWRPAALGLASFHGFASALGSSPRASLGSAAPSSSAVVSVYEFESGLEGWIGGFADYPVGEEAFYELATAHSRLPAPLDPTRHAFDIQGNNHSDDLFMFLKRRITGLQPNTTYRLSFSVRFASMYPASAVGIGGSPGSGVLLKCGATSFEPDRIIVPIGPIPMYRMNLDHESHSTGGQDMAAAGHIGIRGSAEVWSLIERTNRREPFQATTAADGSLWLIVGTDSGFEGTTQLFYDRIAVVVE